MKRFKNFIMTLAVLLLTVVLFGLVVFGLASSDINDGVFTAKPSGALPIDVAKSVMMQNECRISEESLNSYFAYILDLQRSGSDTFSVNDIYIDLKSADSSCYIRIARGDVSFTVACSCTAAMEDDKIVISLGEASVGKIPLPEWAMKKLLEQVDLGIPCSEIDADDLTVRFPDHYGVELGDLGEAVSLDIRSVSVSDDYVMISTNPVISDSLDNIAGMITDRIGQYFD